MIRKSHILFGLVSKMRAVPIHYYGDLVGSGGDPSDPVSGAALADSTTVAENRSLVQAWVLSHASLDSGAGWSECDVGTLGADDRAVCSSTRACRKHPARAWIADVSEPVFQAAAQVLQGGLPGLSLETVTFADWELLRYEEGGFFIAHFDRQRGPCHVGTLLLVAPSADIAGGELLDEDGVPAWSTGEPHVVFVPLGVRHRVAVVTSGSRVVAKAAVHGIVSAEYAVVRRDNAAYLALHSPCD
jgi:hypothetical protein